HETASTCVGVPRPLRDRVLVGRSRVWLHRRSHAHAQNTSEWRENSFSVASTSRNEMPKSNAETAAAWAGFARISWVISTGAVSVLFGMLPDTKTIAPNSPRLRANVSRAPAALAGRSAGSITLRNVVHRPAPRT